MRSGCFFSLALMIAGIILSIAETANGQAPPTTGLGVGVSIPTAEPTEGVPGLDIAKVTNPQAKAALEELVKKQATVKEAILGEMKVTMKTAKGETTTMGSAMTRRPNLVRGYEKLVGGSSASEMNFLNDGNTYWMISKLIRNNGQSLPPFISRIDMEKVKQAGLPAYAIEQSAPYRNPLAIADPATLKLESESPETWIFTADVGDFPGKAAVAEKMTLSMTYSKADGLVRKLIFSPNVTVTFDKIQINPQPPIRDAIFAYTPQPGLEVHDSTDSTIQALKGEK